MTPIKFLNYTVGVVLCLGHESKLNDIQSMKKCLLRLFYVQGIHYFIHLVDKIWPHGLWFTVDHIHTFTLPTEFH